MMHRIKLFLLVSALVVVGCSNIAPPVKRGVGTLTLSDISCGPGNRGRVQQSCAEGVCTSLTCEMPDLESSAFTCDVDVLSKRDSALIITPTTYASWTAALSAMDSGGYSDLLLTPGDYTGLGTFIASVAGTHDGEPERRKTLQYYKPVSYTHLTLPTNREV